MPDNVRKKERREEHDIPWKVSICTVVSFDRDLIMRYCKVVLNNNLRGASLSFFEHDLLSK